MGDRTEQEFSMYNSDDPENLAEYDYWYYEWDQEWNDEYINDYVFVPDE